MDAARIRMAHELDLIVWRSRDENILFRVTFLFATILGGLVVRILGALLTTLSPVNHGDMRLVMLKLLTQRTSRPSGELMFQG